MRKTSAHFICVLRFVKKQEETTKADAFARDLSDKDVDGFWKTMHKMNSHNTVQVNVIDGVTGQDNIADHWRQHFQHILNAKYNIYSMCSLVVSVLDSPAVDPRSNPSSGSALLMSEKSQAVYYISSCHMLID